MELKFKDPQCESQNITERSLLIQTLISGIFHIKRYIFRENVIGIFGM